MKLMNKVSCKMAIYEILSIEDPKKYPRPMNTSVPSITPDGGSCIVSEPDEPEPYNLVTIQIVIQYCDCSDPKNYDFYDEGKF